MLSTAQVRSTRKPLKTIRRCKSTKEVLLYLCQRSPFTAETSPYGTSQLKLQHHHLLFYMNLRALMALSISWPLQRDTHLPHKYAGWRTKLSPWSQNRPSKSKRLVTVGMKNGELQTLTMNFGTSTLPLITNVVTTPLFVNAIRHTRNFLKLLHSVLKLQTFLHHLKQCNMY